MEQHTNTPTDSAISWRAWLANGLIVGTIVILAPLLVIGAVWLLTGQKPELFGAQPPQLPPPNMSEMLLVPLDETVTTTARYTGQITLVIEGSVNQDGLIDLFYRHTDSLGLPLDEPLSLAAAVLLINDEPLDVPPPEYAPFHVYDVLYDVGETAHQLTFRINLPASSGQFHVFIVPGASGG